MERILERFKSVTALCLVLISSVLYGCGGGGGGSSGGGGIAPERPVANVSGVAFDGLIIGGDVRVYDFSGANKGELLGTGKTNGQGLYTVNLSTSNKPVLVEIDGGYYIEEATGIQVQVDRTKGRKMLAVEYYESGKPIELSATFFSTVATGLVEYMVHKQGLSSEVAIERAYAEMDDWAGFDTRHTTPFDVSAAVSATPYLTDSHRYGFVPAGISALTYEVGAATGDGVHDVFTSISFIQTAYNDVRADGLLDGIGIDGYINFGNLAVSGNTYRELLSMRMLQFVRGGRNQTGLSFAEVLPFASRINTYAGELFENTSAPDITEVRPVISQLTPGNGVTMSGTFPVSVLVNDPYGIESIHVYIGQKFVVAASLSDGRADIDTFNFANGNYVLRVEVTNFMGNSVSMSRDVIINNGKLSLSGSGSYQTAYTKASNVGCDATFTVQDSTALGISYAKEGERVLLLETDQSATVVIPFTFSADTVAKSGSSCINRSVLAEDRLGNVYSMPFRVKAAVSDARFRNGDIEVKYECSWAANATC